MPKQRFAVFDIDGTLFRWQLFHQLIFELIKRGALPQDIEQKVAEPLNDWYNRTHPEAFRTYEHALLDAIGDSFAGLPVKAFDLAARDIVEQNKGRVYNYTRDLVTKLQAQGYFTIALSASFEEIVELFAAEYKFDVAIGMPSERKNGHFTGKFHLMHYKKAELLKEVVATHNLAWQGSVGVGDTKNDIPMLELVEQPIAFNPNQELFTHAISRGWRIVVERKNVAYQLAPDTNGRYILQNK